MHSRYSDSSWARMLLKQISTYMPQLLLRRVNGRADSSRGEARGLLHSGSSLNWSDDKKSTNISEFVHVFLSFSFIYNSVLSTLRTLTCCQLSILHFFLLRFGFLAGKRVTSSASFKLRVVVCIAKHIRVHIFVNVMINAGCCFK